MAAKFEDVTITPQWFADRVLLQIKIGCTSNLMITVSRADAENLINDLTNLLAAKLKEASTEEAPPQIN